jgi:hypothetical protein
MTQRTHRTSEQWAEIHQDWIASGLSLPKYCKQVNVPYQSLYNYSRRQSPAQIELKSKPAPLPAFIEVGSLESTEKPVPIEIVLDIGHNIQLRIRQST